MTNDTILVIGASSELARSTIRLIDKPCTTILAHYHSRGLALNNMKAEIQGRMLSFRADLSKEQEWERLIVSMRDYDPPSKMVLFAAPRAKQRRFKDLSWGEFSDQLAVQVGASQRLIREYLPSMCKQEYGKIIFVLSSVLNGKVPSRMADYVTAKYAYLGLMKCLVAEYSSKGIRINAVSPSMVDTGFLADLPRRAVEFSAEAHPLSRIATPEDVAPLISFLLSPDSDYISGSNIPITGGLDF